LSFLDLGSGGGLPGLVLLDRWRCAGVFLDSMVKRSSFLAEVLAWPDAPTHGQVVTARAEEAARWPEFDETFDLVTARSFGPPAVTAECAVRFLRIGGLLVVSERPDSQGWDRWPESGLDRLGLQRRRHVRFEAGYVILKKVTRTPREFPRQSGTPKKRPLF
jgi:16S rRNA (guanine527-N7)-methyltransferase